MPAKPKKGAATSWISAAQCAALTGLSARALRVYEQQKLLKPVRNSNGWRQYSSADLTRLNTIAVLKALGLTLAQIRAQLVSGSSSLEGVLHMQMEAWRSRKTAAEEAIALVEGALKHIRRHREIPIDRMCELVRCLEINGYVPDYQGLIAKHITADDSQAWSAWWVEHPDDLAESGRYLEAQSSLFRELKAAMDAGANPGAAQVGSLMARWESLFLTHHVRERAVRQMRWNYDVTLKWYTVGHKNRLAERQAKNRNAGEDDLYTAEFAAFLDAAYQQSAHGKALNAVHDAVTALIASRASPSLIKRLYGKSTERARSNLFGGKRPTGTTPEFPVLYGFSRHLVARPKDWPDSHRICGHWSLPTGDWQAPHQLLEFLSRGEPPIYVGLGAASSFVRQKGLTEIFSAIGGRRALFYPGWSKITSAILPKNVFVLGDTPHTWLFPRTSMVIHHGGAGTTHTASRAGVPSVVLPFGADQPFWAGRLASVGVAAPNNRRGKWDRRSIAKMIEFAEQDVVRERAKTLGASMADENGVAIAVQEIEALLTGGVEAEHKKVA